jgi:malonyl-CoA decarboxylase
MFERFAEKRSLEIVRQSAKRLMGAQGESNAQSMAAKLIEHWEKLSGPLRLAFFDFLASEFNPDPLKVKAAAEAYHAQPTAHNLIQLFDVVEPDRQELLRRINRAPQGTSAVIKMRECLLPQLSTHPEWAAIDADMHHLLSSWFNPGFLELHEITWDSPAQLLEKIIQHEAVHAIDGWDDLRRRLQPDRRCYAFFHRQLPGEPLIFVEVALLPGIATDVGLLIDKKSEVAVSKTFKTAIFYSISNCQPGLKGVSLGNFLIKRVAQKLIEEMPSLKQFSTLSPIPGFTHWLEQGAQLPSFNASPAQLKRFDAAVAAVGLGGKKWSERLKEGWHPSTCSPEQKQALMRLGAVYLMHYTLEKRGDAVAKFHLSNGATLFQLNWAGDVSKKGLQQSAGLMVNYLYELDKVEAQHEAFSKGQIVSGRAVNALLQ